MQRAEVIISLQRKFDVANVNKEFDSSIQLSKLFEESQLLSFSMFFIKGFKIITIATVMAINIRINNI